jgi:tRNA(Ile)-lysidine synthase
VATARFASTRVEQGGIAVATKPHASSCVARAPGDRFQAGARRPPRSLKLQFQARGVAPALRDGPIVCRGRRHRVRAGPRHRRARASRPGERQVAIAWLPAEAARGERRRGAG